jgi:pimeloyl-ACP methyl ester carboxylesterase
MRGAVGDIQMHWRESGRGQAVLFIHGFPFHGGQWAEQVDRLPERWRWLAPDLRGFGESQAGMGDGPLEMDLFADDLANFLEQQGIERAVVCGLSMGGYIALALWRWHPERVRALVLCNTRAAGDTEEGKERRRALSARVEREGAAAAVDALLPNLLSERTRREHPEVVERVRTMIERTPARTIIDAHQGLADRPDSTELLPTITVPTLLIAGSDDRLTPPADLEFLAGIIPDSRLRVIEGAGHLTNLEAPAAFNLELVHFLEALGGR